MRLFSSKQKEQSRRTASDRQPTKVSNYYTPANRTTSRPKIDTTTRWAPKKSQAGQHHYRLIFRNIIIAALALFFAYSLLYLRSDPIIIIDTETTTGRQSAYEPVISTMLRESIFNSNKLTLQAADIEKRIVVEFPELSNVVVSTTLVGKRPVVHISQQTLPFTIESKGKAYVIAEDGVVAGESSVFTGVEKTIPLRDESGIEVKKGTRVLRSDDAEFFTITSDILRKKSRGVELIRLTAVPREAYIKIKNLPYELRVFLDEPADVQIGTFFSAEKTLGERGEVPTTYMDLRAGEKVFWL